MAYFADIQGRSDYTDRDRSRDLELHDVLIEILERSGIATRDIRAPMELSKSTGNIRRAVIPPTSSYSLLNYWGAALTRK